jgi:hypothetical protein
MIITVQGIKFEYRSQKEFWAFYNKIKKDLVGKGIKDKITDFYNRFDFFIKQDIEKENNSRIKELFDTQEYIDYKSYLQSKEWLLVKKQIIAERNKCELCSSKQNLVVHHIKYKNVIFKELTNKQWIMLVCRLCHQSIHFDKQYILIDPKRNNKTVCREIFFKST